MTNANNEIEKIADAMVRDRYRITHELLGEVLAPNEMYKVHKVLWDAGMNVYTDRRMYFARPGFKLKKHGLWYMHERDDDRYGF